MYRRRRPSREIQFSFDSFLDVVANVCGIIIRLILVAWIGARSYHAIAANKAVEDAASPAVVAAATPTATGPIMQISDPLERELQRHRQELEQEQQRLLEQLRKHQDLQAATDQSAGQLTSLTATAAKLTDQQQQLEQLAKDRTGAAQRVRLTMADLKERSDRLAAELRELEKQPPPTKVLRYRTPVSRPVHSEELHFECRRGRISFVDIDAFLLEVKHDLPEVGKLLHKQWQVEGITGPVGAFRLHYRIERDRGSLDVGNAPDEDTGFHYGLSGWVAEPVVENRGETAAAALARGSDFRRLADAIDPEHTVVTMWVYPDSFALYRQVRDYLHEHNVEVAGRPLVEEEPIAASRDGTASRGQ
jgi:hypothetical protein